MVVNLFVAPTVVMRNKMPPQSPPIVKPKPPLPSEKRLPEKESNGPRLNEEQISEGATTAESKPQIPARPARTKSQIVVPQGLDNIVSNMGKLSSELFTFY